MPSLSNTAEWVIKAHSIHGDKYDYSLSVYTRWDRKVIITCKEHGEFLQTPNGHLNGKGCPACGVEVAKKSRIGNLKEWLEKATLKHGDTYDYSQVVFKGARHKVKIICKTHGVFTQAAGSHLSGCGCPGCGNYGFDKSVKGYLYFLVSEDCKFLKIGITKSPQRRLKEVAKSTPFKFTVLKIETSDGHWVAQKESEIKTRFMNAGLKGFDGATEWLILNEDLIKEVIWSNLTNTLNACPSLTRS